MALSVPRPPGVSQMMKEGAHMYSGLEEAIYRNISACKEFTASLRSAYGPNGMKKMIINHLGKQIVTSDAGTIIRELDVEHPAVKLIVLGSQMQEMEVGDGTNFVVMFAGALLEQAEELLRLGITTVEIADGYQKALIKSLEILEKLILHKVDLSEIAATKSEDKPNKQVTEVIKSSIMTKQSGGGLEEFITNLIYKACVSNLRSEKETSFNTDNVRVCKILGRGVYRAEVVDGMVFKRFVEGDVNSALKAKVALYGCPVDILQTETKGTVLIKSAAELTKFSRGEETHLEQQIKAIADTGAKVVVAGAKFGDLALHFCNKYGLMAVRLMSKFDLRRLSKTVNGTVLPKLTAPTQEELGYCDSVVAEDVADTTLVAFRNNETGSKISTIILRGATDKYMDDLERTIDDGVNTFKALTKNGSVVPGAGATEIEIAQQLAEYADTLFGLNQYAVRKFATALEVFPKALAENSGLNATEVTNKLYAAHQNGEKTAGIDIDAESATTIDVTKASIYDLYITKMWALKYAVEAASTILMVDQIIVAKRAGGPKARQPGPTDQDDD